MELSISTENLYDVSCQSLNKVESKRTLKFIDLFAGIGGLRLGFENACKIEGLEAECVMTSEIKDYALKSLKNNFKHNLIVGDISKVPSEYIPNFDILLAGFPCQPFSAGGKRQGFSDTRGTLFFEIERIIEAKMPVGFLLENVEGLVKHDLESKNDKIGRTLSIIIDKLESLGYHVSWEVLDSKDFGLPQSRKRIYIAGSRLKKVNLKDFKKSSKKVEDILDSGLPTLNTRFINSLLTNFKLEELHGKSIKDKRGGGNNIHSWELGLKGQINEEQHILLNKLFKERRKKKWALEHGIDWMDGMPLTLNQIRTFHNSENLEELLNSLVVKGYLRCEHPKVLVKEETPFGVKTTRKENRSLKQGYNIVTGKLSFEVNKIIDPKGITPTLVATDMERFVVPDNGGLRKLTLREGLRLFGYPEWFNLPVKDKEGYDLLGNTVAVSVVESVVKRIISSI